MNNINTSLEKLRDISTDQWERVLKALFEDNFKELKAVERLAATLCVVSLDFSSLHLKLCLQGSPLRFVKHTQGYLWELSEDEYLVLREGFLGGSRHSLPLASTEEKYLEILFPVICHTANLLRVRQFLGVLKPDPEKDFVLKKD